MAPCPGPMCRHCEGCARMDPRHTFYASAPGHKAYHGGPPLRPPGLAHQPRARFCRARVKGSTDKYTKPRGISQAAHGKHAHLAHTLRLLLNFLDPQAPTAHDRPGRHRCEDRHAANFGIPCEANSVCASQVAANAVLFMDMYVQWYSICWSQCKSSLLERRWSNELVPPQGGQGGRALPPAQAPAESRHLTSWHRPRSQQSPE